MNRALFTTAEVAALCQVSERLVTRWCRERRIPHVRLGPKTYRFDPDAVAHWLAQAAVAAEGNDHGRTTKRSVEVQLPVSGPDDWREHEVPPVAWPTGRQARSGKGGG